MSDLAPPGCTCGMSSPRCEACAEQLLMWLRGTAKMRGETWAKRVAALVGTERDWPAFEGRVVDIARRQVAGLVSDAGVTDRLARECHAFAGWIWGKLRNR